MGTDNKSARHLLERLYGKGCMFERAHIPERLLQLDIKIKGYRLYVSETRYKRRKINKLESTMTYHHLQHRSEGGRTTIENGSVINELAHRYIHSLPRDQEEIINNMLRDYKQSFGLKGGILVPTDVGIETIQPIKIDLDYEIDDDCIVIPVCDTIENEKDKNKSFSRARTKQETRLLIDEVLSEVYEDDDLERE